jgi:hypothetical protein
LEVNKCILDNHKSILNTNKAQLFGNRCPSSKHAEWYWVHHLLLDNCIDFIFSDHLLYLKFKYLFDWNNFYLMLKVLESISMDLNTWISSCPFCLRGKLHSPRSFPLFWFASFVVHQTLFYACSFSFKSVGLRCRNYLNSFYSYVKGSTFFSASFCSI